MVEMKPEGGEFGSASIETMSPPMPDQVGTGEEASTTLLGHPDCFDQQLCEFESLLRHLRELHLSALYAALPMGELQQPAHPLLTKNVNGDPSASNFGAEVFSFSCGDLELAQAFADAPSLKSPKSPKSPKHNHRKSCRNIGKLSCRMATLEDLPMPPEVDWVTSKTGTISPAQRRHRVLHFVGHIFYVLSSFMIVSHLLVTGAEVEFEAVHQRRLPVFSTLGILFNIYYIVELIVKILCQRSEFCSRQNRFLNCFDSLLVMFSLLEMFVIAENDNEGTSNIRMIRIVRAFRIMRVLKIGLSCQTFLDFYKMVFAIGSAARTLGWALVVLLMLIYIFAVVLAQDVTSVVMAGTAPSAVEAELKKYFGDVLSSAYSLYKAISGGQSWGELVEPLKETGYLMPCVFVFYIALAVIGVLNVVNSIFIESAMKTGEKFRELAVMETKINREANTRRVIQFFKEMDTDESGTLTMEELEEFLKQDVGSLWLSSLGVDQNEAHRLFSVLDSDGSGEVDCDEFFSAFTKLQGVARSFDINCLLVESRAMMKRLDGFSHHMEDQLNVVSTILDRRVSALPKERMSARYSSAGMIQAEWT